jgi:hypothetical protein
MAKDDKAELARLMADKAARETAEAESATQVAECWFRECGIPDDAIPALVEEYSAGARRTDRFGRIAQDWLDMHEWVAGEWREKSLPPTSDSPAPTYATLRAAIRTAQTQFMGEYPLNPWAHHWFPILLNMARLIPGAPPLPPIPIPSSSPIDRQEALAALDALLRWCDEAEGRKGAAAQPPSPPSPEWVFARDGDGYFIKAFGNSGHFKNTKGFKQLEKLLLNIGKPVLMTELASDNRPGQSVSASQIEQVMGEGASGDDDGRTWHVDGTTQDDAYDKDGLKNIHVELLRLGEEIDNAKCNCDTAEVERLTAERQELQDQLKRDTNFKGKPRGMSSGIDKLRAAINGTLKGAYEKLRSSKPALSELAEHLYGNIGAEGPTYIYYPKPRPPWSFDRER